MFVLVPPKCKCSLKELKDSSKSEFHTTYVLVPVDKAANNIVIV